mmetsp:Transcript_14215/g.28148  ORF Transcript_14215/g.28148 Transcript_14215/m.28148 type:complete len:233 (-) Transcript_14215:6-704(-)
MDKSSAGWWPRVGPILPLVWLACHVVTVNGKGRHLADDETEDTARRLSLLGTDLQRCDRPAYMAAHPEGADRRYPSTGYSRDNYCGSMTHDQGSHYVCVELPRAVTKNGEVYSDFWTRTGQASRDTEAVTWPKPGPWCICMWAFARMLDKNPDFSEMVECEATNYWVVQNYDLAQADECRALRALCTRCSLDSDTTRRDSIRQKCRLAQKICPAKPGEADAGTCSRPGGCDL